MLLALGSAVLHRSLQHERIERQRPFRRCMVTALVAGTLFVGVQCYGLSSMVRHQDPSKVATGVNSFVLAFAAMHFIHFTVAFLFVAFVTVNALADRYDHEYYWGVTVCAYFWHVLGIAWALILGIYAIAY